MIRSIIKHMLGRGYISYEKSHSDLDINIQRAEVTLIKLMNSLYSEDLVDEKSIVSEYYFFEGSNVLKCLNSSAVIISDKFSERLDSDKFIICKPDTAFQGCKDDDDGKDNKPDSEIMSAKEWNNFWKDINHWMTESKPLVAINKKPILFSDLMGMYEEGSVYYSFEQGTIPHELSVILQYSFKGVKDMSPVTIDISYDLDIDTFVKGGLK